MDSRPRVLIFDDNKDWAELLAMTISEKYQVTKISDPDKWNIAISSTHWDVIIVDVQILGSTKTGIEYAEESILEFKLVTPIIVISGVMALETMKSKCGKMFSDYITKDDYNERLLSAVDKACAIDTKSEHIKNMLTAIANKYKILENTVPIELLEEPIIFELFNTSNGKTLSDLINLVTPGGKQYLNKLGRTIFYVIEHEKSN